MRRIPLRGATPGPRAGPGSGPASSSLRRSRPFRRLQKSPQSGNGLRPDGRRRTRRECSRRRVRRVPLFSTLSSVPFKKKFTPRKTCLIETSLQGGPTRYTQSRKSYFGRTLTAGRHIVCTYLAAGRSDEDLSAVGVIVQAHRPDAGGAAPQERPAHQVELVHHAELRAQGKARRSRNASKHVKAANDEKKLNRMYHIHLF